MAERGKVSVTFLQEEDISKLVECMALNSASSSEEEESEASEVRMRILKGRSNVGEFI